MREWTEVGFSSIYYLLKKLEQEGWVEGRLEEAARGPARKVYRVTPSGEAALHGGVIEALSAPQRHYSPFLLGLSHLAQVPLVEAVEALRNYCRALSERLAHVQGNWHRQRPLPGFVDALFDHSVTMIKAELEWVEAFIEKMEDEHDQG